MDTKTNYKVNFSRRNLHKPQLWDKCTEIEIFEVTYELWLFGSFVSSKAPNLKEARKDLLNIIHSFYSTDYEHYYINYGVRNWSEFKKRFLSGRYLIKKAYFHTTKYSDSTRTQLKYFSNDVVELGSYLAF